MSRDFDLQDARVCIEELEAGLHIVDSLDASLTSFWDRNIASFRQTVLIAIGETSEALRLSGIPHHWRVEFEGQLEVLVKYLELADRYMARRLLSCERPLVRFPDSRLRSH